MALRSTQPPPLYPPRRQSLEALAREAGEAADIALRSAKIAKKAAASISQARPASGSNVRRLSGQEQGFLARISPCRNRWPELRAIDLRLAELDRRQEELRMTLIDLRGQRERADAACAAELAAWMAAGEQEPKPVSKAKALDEAIADAEAEHAANAPLSPRTHSPLESPCSSSRR